MEKVEKNKFPIGQENYTLYEEVGEGVSASVYRALCKPNNEIVAVKVFDFERCNSDLKNISHEAQTMFLIDNANVLKSHCSFVNEHNLWVVMPYMAGGSCLHIMKASHPDGLEEVVIATILREVLKGLEYLHNHGHIHRDIKAGNILIGSRGTIKLGDLGVSACLFESGDRQRIRKSFVGTTCWMAPEVMEQTYGYDFKADIWSFGITALELAHGHAPFAKYPPMKVFLMTVQNAPPGLDCERDKKKFSKLFNEMIASCLVKDPSKRPTSTKLLKHSFFKQARSNDYLVRKLLDGLPPLGDRIRELKVKEEHMLAQKKMPYGEKEELSQSEYKRGISGWIFDLEDVKAQASLIADDEEQGAVTDTSSMDSHSRLSVIVEENAMSRNSSLASIPSTESLPKTPSFKSPKKHEGGSRNEATMPPESTLKTSKTTTTTTTTNNNNIGEEIEATVSIIQRKGRFKVCSEIVDHQKQPPPPPYYYSSSSTLPNITPHVVTSSASATVCLRSQSDEEEKPPQDYHHFPTTTLFPFLQTILQANVTQNVDVCYEREKELLEEISSLQWRLICAEEKIQKLTTDKVHVNDQH